MLQLWKWVTVKKYVTVGNVFHSWKDVSQLEKWVTLEKMCHNWKNGSVVKNVCTCKNGSQLTKCFRVGKMGHTYKFVSWKNGKHLKNVSHDPHLKACHSGKNGSH